MSLVGVEMPPKLLMMCGSCISMMSQFLLLTLLISSWCAVFDLLRLICMIRREGGAVGCGCGCCVGCCTFCMWASGISGGGFGFEGVMACVGFGCCWGGGADQSAT